ncbi:hypothetical protein [Paraburkholderia flagellata]|uniref:hypothetical protein n=1 Tax=Paraburkholderia flagellata TaxID=2883241 RepID=UPI001F3E9DA6|nr:hypothetical protein [Paraburkholderia flagellata]
MTIYIGAPVEDEPEIFLECWSLRRTDEGAVHFVGFSVQSGDGRVSTKIVEFDPKRRTGLTESGRRYWLLGSGGYDSDAEYVWNWLVAARKISGWTNVTPELVPDWRTPEPAVRDEEGSDDASESSKDSPDAT